jgi:hypothetical protein
MRKFHHIVVVYFGLMLLLGCQGQRAGMDAYSDQLNRMYEGYLSPDPKLAEQALLEHETTIRKWEKQGLRGLDYPYIYRVTESRLLTVYVHTGEEQKAQRTYQSLTNIMALNHTSHVWSMQEVIADVEGAETNLLVLWRKK